jgi:hydrogenase expression/formation protein HypE
MKKNTFSPRSCPLPKNADEAKVTLSEGSGGKEMQSLINTFCGHLSCESPWSNCDNDSATFPLPTMKQGHELVFTTDSYVVTPLFFPGGNIGKIAFCGTVNDLSMMGGKPLGLSLSLILEEGLSKNDLNTIIETIGQLAKETSIPIVTGDTKVMEKGSIDKIVINTSGVGITENTLNHPIQNGDQIIVSGSLGEHGATLLSQRFDLESDLITDSRPLHKEIAAIQHLIKQAKDITRGGLSAVLNELAQSNNKKFLVQEEDVPLKKEVRSLTDLLGIDPLSLACEGRFVCVCSEDTSEKVLDILQTFDPSAALIGDIQNGRGVISQTRLGQKIIPQPSGNIVPRIC